jgi:glycosyltransferase involved in cell wall biosynthesis
MRLAIIIATYQRLDGKSPMYLERTLDCIDRQTFRDYKIYLIGDAYRDDAELKAIAKRHVGVVCVNLVRSVERDRYGVGNMNIWCAGGVTAVNKGIEMALADGYEYICHQAHDDVWEMNHLEVINRMVEERKPIFCCTSATYLGAHILPGLPITNEMLPFYPIDGGIVASVTCVKYTDTKIRVMDRLHVEGIQSPCDAYLWEQLRNEMKATGKEGCITTTITGHHDEEGSVMRNQQYRRRP